MIRAADCGVGIEGKEGRQASLAADFSSPQLKHVGLLLMVHGRNSHVIISTMQVFYHLHCVPCSFPGARDGLAVPRALQRPHQGGILMYGALLLFESEFVHVVAVSFTALLMVALNIRTWHWLMVLAEFLSLGCYIDSLAFLNEYFGLAFITTPAFLWKVSVISVVSCLPLYIIKYLKRKFSPPSYSKLPS